MSGLYCIATPVSKQGQADAFRAVRLPATEAIRKEAGCLAYTLLEDETKPGPFVSDLRGFSDSAPHTLSQVRLARALPHAAVPHPLPRGRTVINDQSRDDIRGLFDWRSAAGRLPAAGVSASPDIGNDDLALALQLLSCNSRDREQFGGTRAGADVVN